MERTEVLDMMGTLKLYGMKGAYDETLATAIKRKHEPQRLVGDLLKAEISEKQARHASRQGLHRWVHRDPHERCVSHAWALRDARVPLWTTSTSQPKRSRLQLMAD